MNAAPRVSVVISSRERHAFLTDAVASLLAGSEVPDEIIVVDQSDRPHPKLADVTSSRRCRVRYIHTAQRGLSRGRNEGIVAASGEILAFIDDDVLVPAEWLGLIVTTLIDAGDRAVVTGRVLAGPSESDGAFAPSTKPADHRVVYQGRVGEDILMPHCMALWRRSFDDVGLFDVRLGAGARFPSSEDNDLGFRLLEAGYRIVHEPSVFVNHRAWRPPADWVSLRWNYGLGQGAYFAKWLSLRDRYMLRRLWHNALRHLKRAPRRALHDRRAAAGDAAYGTAVFVGALSWLVTHRWHR